VAKWVYPLAEEAVFKLTLIALSDVEFTVRVPPKAVFPVSVDVPATVRLAPIDAPPPTFTLPAIPDPPKTTKAPDDTDPDDVVSVIVRGTVRVDAVKVTLSFRATDGTVSLEKL
jgi:hypothetical protein